MPSCGKVFSSIRNQRAHSNFHVNNNHCIFCNKRIPEITNIFNHFRSHNGEKPFFVNCVMMHFHKILFWKLTLNYTRAKSVVWSLKCGKITIVIVFTHQFCVAKIYIMICRIARFKKGIHGNVVMLLILYSNQITEVNLIVSKVFVQLLINFYSISKSDAINFYLEVY